MGSMRSSKHSMRDAKVRSSALSERADCGNLAIAGQRAPRDNIPLREETIRTTGDLRARKMSLGALSYFRRSQGGLMSGIGEST
jgi:hypothetical protein